MRFHVTPLKVMRETQPFGVDWTAGGNFYKSLGLKGHDGLDLRAAIGTPIYAVAAGRLRVTGSVNDPGYGLACRLTVPDADRGGRNFVEVIYGHLSKAIGERDVEEGEVIGETGNSGNSSGPHCHWATRRCYYSAGGAGPFVEDYGNGFLGYVDPKQFLADDVFALPVDRKYGNIAPPSVEEFAKAYLYVLRAIRRLPSTREYNALRYGYWDLRYVIDPSMFMVWSEMSKPEAVRRGIVK